MKTIQFKFLFALVVIIGLFSGCKKLNLPVTVPDCVERDIKRFERQDGGFDNAVAVYQWLVDGKIYYYYASDCCDQFNYLYDEECNLVCAPDGGFGGNGDGNCPEFVGDITEVLVWKKE